MALSPGRSPVTCAGQPDDRLGDELRARGERVVGKDFHQVGEPADRLIPALGCGQRRALVGRRDEHRLAELESVGQIAVERAVLDRASEDETSARVGDHVDTGIRPPESLSSSCAAFSAGVPLSEKWLKAKIRGP